MIRSYASIFKYFAASSCVVTSGLYLKLINVPKIYEDRLGRIFKLYEDHLEQITVSLLQSIDLEDSNPFENEFHVQSHNVYSIESVKIAIYSYLQDVRRWVALKFLVTPHSPKSYDLFLSTYGFGFKGLQRVARLCCYITPNDIFVNAMKQREHQDPYDVMDVIHRLLKLLSTYQFSNECINGVLTKLSREYQDFKETANLPVGRYNDDDLDIGRPIITYAKKSPQQILNDIFRLISEILDSTDGIAKSNLLNLGLVETLLLLRQSDENNRISMLDLLSKISCDEQFVQHLLNKDLIYYAAGCLKDQQVELRSMGYKILHNVSHKDKIKLNSYVGYPINESDPYQINVIFLHGLLGKAHRTWRCNDTAINTENHSYCWPLEWLPTSLKRRSLTPKIILMTYPTAVSSYSTYCLTEEHTLQQRADILRQNIASLKLRGPIVLVGHSMGGLLLKQIIVQASECGDTDFLSAISGICFYSTPHHGSWLAKYATSNPLTKKILNPTIEVQELSSSCDYLSQLNNTFYNVVANNPKLCNILSFVETVPTKMFGAETLIVDTASAQIEYGNVIQISENHINVNKPVSRSDPAYSELVNFILHSTGE